jgi:hypothetical protein
MSWAKLDDQFYDHPKVSSISQKYLTSAVGLYCLALCWCANQLTDGRIPKPQVSRLTGGICNGNVKSVQELVRVGLWVDAGDEYVIHDYLQYNPSRAKVLEERESAKRRRSASGKRNPNVTRTLAERQAKVIDPDPVPEDTNVSLGDNERECLNILKAALGSRFDFDTELSFIRTQLVDFPFVDVAEELRKWKTWLIDKPLTTKSRPHSQIRNWLKNAKPSLFAGTQFALSEAQRVGIVIVNTGYVPTDTTLSREEISAIKRRLADDPPATVEKVMAWK